MTVGVVPRLADLCTKVLQANVASIQDVGDVPYHFLREVLPGCRVDQLREIEDLSPQIAEEDEGGLRLATLNPARKADYSLLLPWVQQKSGRASSDETSL